MDISLSALVSQSMQMQQSQLAQNVQLTVLKKSLDMQANNVMTLLDSMPLATIGNVGTQVNTTA
ncbi:MAG: hypothetical protein COZ09_05480 [Comamonadaceae bacterium CG_4_10_14_3_um_filter_60_42]|nr:MAG: hypothetical protein AUK51_13470 [Comamonadaceae bacterium CG2_30_59_20]PIY29276.1 MAG: hypothetical protein COZ09_05480 [Comamonadaceae bacterium CG_4_10_14_3_um_filter_60_42]